MKGEAQDHHSAKSRWKFAFRQTRLQQRTEHALHDRVRSMQSLEDEARAVLAHARTAAARRQHAMDDDSLNHDVAHTLRQLMVRATAARKEAVRRQAPPRTRWLCAGVERHLKEAIKVVEASIEKTAAEVTF